MGVFRKGVPTEQEQCGTDNTVTLQQSAETYEQRIGRIEAHLNKTVPGFCQHEIVASSYRSDSYFCRKCFRDFEEKKPVDSTPLVAYAGTDFIDVSGNRILIQFLQAHNFHNGRPALVTFKWDVITVTENICPDCGRDFTGFEQYKDFVHYKPGTRDACLSKPKRRKR